MPCGRSWPGRAWTRPGHHLLAPGPPPPDPGLPGHDQPVSGPGRAGHPRAGKRPKSSYLRFEAEQPNECWQSDFTHYPLADGTGREILTWLDDHSRLALSVTAHRRVTGPIVLTAFRATVAAYGPRLDFDGYSRWVLSWEAVHGPAGGVRLPGDRRLPVVVADRSGHTACVTSCLLFTGRAGVPPRMAGPVENPVTSSSGWIPVSECLVRPPRAARTAGLAAGDEGGNVPCR